MKRFVLETDTYSLYTVGHPRVIQAIVWNVMVSSIGLTVITAEEARGGYAALVAKASSPSQLASAYARLAGFYNDVGNWRVYDFLLAAQLRYEQYKRQKLNVKANDMKIGAIAVEAGATVVTRNRQDFARIPGVHHVDWSV